MQRNFSKISLLITIIFFVFSFAVFFFLYREIKNSNAKLKLATEEFQNESYRREEVKSLENSIKIIENERKQLETHFARSSDIVPFLNTIEALGRIVGVKASVVAVDIPANNTGLFIGINALGSFQGVYKFLALLENSPYALEFVSVDLRSTSGEETSEVNIHIPQWEANFKMKLLSFIK